MFIKAVLSPSLGATTIIDSSTEAIQFVTSLEVSRDTQYDWIVELWYGRSHSDWQSAAFSPATSNEVTIFHADAHPATCKRIFTLSLPVDENPSPISFTLRFKPSVQAEWIWSQEQYNIPDGLLIFSSPHSSVTFSTLFSGTDSSVSISSLTGSPGVEMFQVTSPAPAIADQWSNINLGTPIDITSYYALAKKGGPWMGPQQGKDTFMVTADTLLMGYLRKDGRHVVILALSGIQDTTTYIRSGTGRVLLKSLNDSGKEGKHQAIIATGFNWQEIVTAAFEQARKMLRSAGVTEESAPEDVQPLWRESWYDGLGYCTWNSLGRELTQDRILASLQDLYDAGIYVTTLIVDDNWQSLDANRRWEKFEANEYFPQGLKGFTSEVKRRFPNIKHIAVWHAIIGYWEGVSPNGWIAKNYKTTTIKWHGGWDVTVVDETDISRLYNDFYHFLSQSGVDSIKCDVQVSLTEFDHSIDRARLLPSYQSALHISSLRYFQGRIIYCMSQCPQLMLPSLLPKTSPTVLLRNSDDFFPNIPDSHLWHLFCNAMNNIYTSNLNVLPDWDMFQTSLSIYGGIHAAGRCISGGPIYITDSPGSHSIPLVRGMAAKSIRDRNRLVILRLTEVAMPVDPYVAYNGNRFLKVTNIFQRGGSGGGNSSMLAIFNTTTTETSEILQLSEFRGMKKDGRYLLRQHGTGQCFPVVQNEDQRIVLTLKKAGWEVFRMVEMRGGIAVLGLLEQIAGVAAVVEEVVGEKEVVVKMKALGVLGIYISDLETRSINNLLILLDGNPIPEETVRKSGQDPKVLEINIETAYEKMGSWRNYSGEVMVTVYL
ncbi:glycoside hydrolase superfamily [Pyronema omphalodes]|nr:glycoside hydrolase superfamily [Pyronema omphalodes]